MKDKIYRASSNANYKTGLYFWGNIHDKECFGRMFVSEKTGKFYLYQNLKTGVRPKEDVPDWTKNYQFSWIQDRFVNNVWLSEEEITPDMIRSLKGNVEDIKKKEIRDYIESKNLLKSGDGDFFLPVELSDIEEGDRWLYSKGASSAVGKYEGKVGDCTYEKIKLYSDGNNHFHTFNFTIGSIRENFEKNGIVLIKKGKTTTCESFDEVVPFKIVYNLSRERWDYVTAIVLDSKGEKIYHLANSGVCMKEGLSLKELTDEEKMDIRMKSLDKEFYSYLNKPNSFDYSRPNLLNTHQSFLYLGKIIGDKFEKTNHFGFKDCCAITKTKEDIWLTIPIEWTNYFGYDEDFVKSYIDMLNEMLEEEVYIFKGQGKIVDFRISTTSQLKDITTQTVKLIQNKGYDIWIKSGDFTMETYFRFILIRYLYNYQYTDIPYTLMDIKGKLGDKISLWKAMLLASMRKNYQSAYSLLDIYRDDSHMNMIKLEGSNSLSNMLDRLANADENGMNKSFKYYKASNKEDIQKYIQEGEYEEAIKFLK